MPYQWVNGAQLYYECYGEDIPNRLPILLIHGSTSTGHADWNEIAPLLGKRQCAIVPDCRGHGRSTNPGNSYSFKELAADAVGLAHALGFPRVHICGHSNGGNVALVALIEYPEAIQSAILQAANAYVSPDLVDIEPEKFNPDRVLRDDPAWVEKMIALHGETHGVDYWWTLLEITVQEIISQPTYTATDLESVQRATLVIQGEKDIVNANGKHGQFIATHIPFAELWNPADVGHSVHKEIPLVWLERVSNFFEKRGDVENEALYRLKQTQYPDPRETIFEVNATKSDNPPCIRLSGQVLRSDQRQAAIQAITPLHKLYGWGVCES